MRTLWVRVVNNKQVIDYHDPVAIPQFTNEQERMEWIKQQADQVAALALEEFRRRLAVVKQRSEKGAAFQRLKKEE